MDAAFGGIDILINNAGITGNRNSFDLDNETWSRVIAINQSGTFYCAQQAGQRMRANGGGTIVNLASIYGLVAAPSRLAYGATKAAIVMMTKILAVEWAQFNIRVNCVAPGYVETPGTSALAEAGIIDLDALRRRTPQGRLAQPEDVAPAIIGFCDDELAHVTGQVLAVDGGWSAYGYV
jgi:NAD(P)-dependent dehydrogenase (short-subunit alcohol dehydrogenase family)